MHYDAIVIGSGFGGSVAACRLAQAGQRVLILERGKRYLAGTSPPSAPLGDPREAYFPRNFSNPLDGWFWKDGQGLFDIRPFSQMFVVQCAGYGGGSLLYANVQLRPPEKVFAKGWPTGYDREALDPYYDLVALMLDIKPITASPAGLPPKTIAMRDAARALGREEQFFYPNLAVTFGSTDPPEPNLFGRDQRGCSYCGECDIGCTFHSKNTLDLNYLAEAERQLGPDGQRRTTVQTLCEAIDILPPSELPSELENGGPAGARRYAVVYLDHADGGKEKEDTATRVFVCAGAVNSTELLLRCQKKKHLPDLSPRLGEGYSGNGDFLSASYDTKVDFQPSVGPTITTAIVVDQGAASDDDAEHTWLILEEGGFPKQLANLIELLNPGNDLLHELGTLLHRGALEVGQAAAKAAQEDPSTDSDGHLAVFISMGRDTANGRVELDACEGARVAWKVPENLPLYNTEMQLTEDLVGKTAFGGKVAFNPLWRAAHQPISVHHLGGCLMADSKEDGVTDPWGEVWGYEGLYVLDGAILPAATGVNPSHTIAAVAERNIEHLLREILSNAEWRAPQFAYAVRRAQAQTPLERDSMAGVTIPPGGTRPPETPVLGLSFAQRMSGFVVDKDLTSLPDSASFIAAGHAGHDAGTAITFDLAIATPDLDRFHADPEHKLIANGTLWIHGLCNENEPAQVVGGTLVQRGAEQRTVYLLPFIGCDTQPYVLEGWADVKDHGEVDVLRAMTTIHAVIRRGAGPTAPIVKIGALHISPADFHASRGSLQITGTTSLLAKLEARTRATGSFFGALAHLFS